MNPMNYKRKEKGFLIENIHYNVSYFVPCDKNKTCLKIDFDRGHITTITREEIKRYGIDI
jgi:hypothetical protein